MKKIALLAVFFSLFFLGVLSLFFDEAVLFVARTYIFKTYGVRVSYGEGNVFLLDRQITLDAVSFTSKTMPSFSGNARFISLTMNPSSNSKKQSHLYSISISELKMTIPIINTEIPVNISHFESTDFNPSTLMESLLFNSSFSGKINASSFSLLSQKIILDDFSLLFLNEFFSDVLPRIVSGKGSFETLPPVFETKNSVVLPITLSLEDLALAQPPKKKSLSDFLTNHLVSMINNQGSFLLKAEMIIDRNSFTGQVQHDITVIKNSFIQAISSALPSHFDLLGENPSISPLIPFTLKPSQLRSIQSSLEEHSKNKESMIKDKH
jgi:hypothetical protein